MSSSALGLASRPAVANPLLAGYADYQQLSRQVAELDALDGVTASSLGRTAGGREIHLLTIGTGRAERKPAVLVVGTVHPPHLLGSELAMSLARGLARGLAEDDPRLRRLLAAYTIYVIPRPDPDGSEKCFARPWIEPAGNERPADDDRDGEVGEDPPNDLNGDGWITLMRVQDAAGRHMPHPSDPRVMIEADARQNDRGRYQLYVEGQDDDEDGQFNEDGSGGVSLNRNFSYRYPAFTPAAGPHPVSEVESRALADFAFERTNIAIVLSFSPDDNLMHPWKSDPQGNAGAIKTSVLPDDAPYFDRIAGEYRKLLGATEPPPASQGAGSLASWAYFHYGRWSFSARGWWVPPVAAADPAAGKGRNTDKPMPSAGEASVADDSAAGTAAGSKQANRSKANDAPSGAKSVDKRAADERNLLRWLDREAIDGFVPWRRIDHPGFPGQRVEVGGFKPFVRLNPPAAELPRLAAAHQEFLRHLLEQMPRFELPPPQVTALGAGLFRIKATVLNVGYLPTSTELGSMGKLTGRPQFALELPQEVVRLRGTRYVLLDRLAGRGGKAEQTWLVRVAGQAPAEGRVRVSAPSVGSRQRTLRLMAEPTVGPSKSKAP